MQNNKFYRRFFVESTSRFFKKTIYKYKCEFWVSNFKLKYWYLCTYRKKNNKYSCDTLNLKYWYIKVLYLGMQIQGRNWCFRKETTIKTCKILAKIGANIGFYIP